MSGIHDRKYGRYESFERFDHLANHASIGSKPIGKINIDCQLLFKNSQWGVLGDGEFPAGVVYLNFNFGPPQGCRIKGATITITLDEEATCLEPYRTGRIFHASGCPVQMGEWFGPHSLVGQAKTADVNKISKLTPQINVLGNGGGGVGFESNKTFTHSARWSFHGQLLQGKNTWTYKSLRWNLNENELESQTFHNNKIRTAFTFQHSGQPFLLRVDINGKLEKWNERIKSKLKFGTDSAKDNQVVTLVDFEDYTRFQKSLDALAKGLPRDMEMQNFQEIPVEVPDPMPGTFFHSAPASPPTESSEQNPALAGISTPLRTLEQPTRPSLPMVESPVSPQEVEEQRPADNESAHEVQELMRALNELGNPDMYKIFPEEHPPFSPSPTAVGSEREGPSTSRETTEITKPQAFQRSTETTEEMGVEDEEAIARALELPLVIMLLRMLASLMELLGNGKRLKEGPRGMAGS